MPPFRRPELFAALKEALLLRRQASPSLLRCLRVVPWLLAVGVCVAQGPVDGALSGVVVDGTGRPVDDAAVLLLSGTDGRERRTRTNAQGRFLFLDLAPGSYRVEARAQKLAESRILTTVTLGATREVVARLRAAGSPEVVTVTEQEPVAPGRGGTVGAAELLQLPSPGLRWQDAAVTVPGVLPDQDADGLVSVHGLPSTQNNLLVDGMDATQSYNSVPVGTGSDAAPDPAEDSDSAEISTGPSQGLARSRHAGIAYSFSQAAVREFRVATQNYSALTGNAAGGVVTTVTKRGTSELHGSAFFVLRSQAFAATNPDSVATSYGNGLVTTGLVKPHDLRENFGATLGGPLAPARRHPLFYFAAYDQQRRGFPAVSTPADPAFYQLTPIQLGLLATRGVRAAAIDSGLSYLSSLTGAAPRRADQEIGFGRLDWSASSRQELGVQFNAARWTSPAGLTDAPTVARGRASIGNAAGSLNTVVARVTTTLTPRWNNQLRLQYLGDLQYESPEQNLPQEPAIGPGAMAPEVNIGPDGLLFGTPANLAQQAFPRERRAAADDTMSVQLGRQLLQFGGSFAEVHDSVATLANAAGTFQYDSTRTSANAGGLVDFLTDLTYNVNAYPNGGCPSITSPVHLFCFTSFSQSFGEQSVAFSTGEAAAFVEDTWRLSRRLTVHAGARYEFLRLPAPQTPNIALDQVFGARGATGVFPEDTNNLGPRVGASWEPFGAGRGVVRIGYGVYFGRLPGATIRAALADTGLANSTTRVRITPSTETVCPQVPGQGFGYPCSLLAQPAGVVATTGSAIVFARDFRLPVVQQGSVSVEHEVGRRVAVSLTYEMNSDRQLASSTDMNIAPSTAMAEFQLQGGGGARGVTPGETFLVPHYTARVTSSFGPVTEIVSHVNGSYNGVVAATSWHGKRGFSARASYGWSKAIDYGASASATPRTNGQFDPYNNGYDKGLSSLNYPQALRFTGVWSSNLETHNSLLRRGLGGWEIAPIVLAHSGRPYSYEIFGGQRLNGGHQSINGSGGALYLPTVGRNTLRLPATINADLRVGRVFSPGGKVLGEALKLRFSAEIFNVTNRRNISSVEERAFLVGTTVGGVTPLVFQDAATIATEGLNTQAFGSPTASSTSLARERQIQLSLHVEF
jgi:hypothetical protein